MYLLTEMDHLCTPIIPEFQQGRLKGGRIYASLLALYALSDAARVQRRRLYVTFVNVRKHFHLRAASFFFKYLLNTGHLTIRYAQLGLCTTKQKRPCVVQKAMDCRFRSM